MLISLFITCFNDTLFPDTGKAVVEVLERLGHTVEFRREQTCCGQMHYNTGYHRGAAELMRDFVGIFRDAEAICAPSASCMAMVREHYPAIAARSGAPALVADVAALVPRVYEFSELLVDRLHVTDVGAEYRHRVTFHASCHGLRGLGLNDQPRRLLTAVRGLELIDLPRHDECCGFGGTFAIKNADVSSAMVADKIDCVLQTGAEVCTAVDNSCLMQIAGALSRRRSPVRCLHLAEILANSEAKSSIRITNPESRIVNPESRIPNPGSRIPRQP
jgi:L-lactate dehydrogenase complex protein LldE